MPILVVEGTETIRTSLVSALRRWGHEVIAAGSGEEAWTILCEDSPRLVLTGWILPDTDGPAFCRKIRSANTGHYIYIILLTALSDTQSPFGGIEAGADDIIRKPIDLDELRARILAGERVLDLERTLQQQNHQLSEMGQALQGVNSRLNHELQLAGQMQRSLLPSRSMVIGGVLFERMLLPSTHVSGDIVNFFRLDEHHIGFYAVDVAGHGVTAAMLSFTICRLLTPELNRGSPLKRAIAGSPYYELVLPSATAIQEVNLQFQAGLDSSLYFTMIYGVVDTQAHSIDLCQAGHPYPLFVDARGRARFIGNGGFPVGVTADAEYESLVFHYERGDRLFIYSDGITECMNGEGEMFGEERLRSFLDSNHHQPLYEALKQLKVRLCEWKGSEHFEDDVSVLAFEIT